jgi:hypothetical protein
VNRIAQRFNRFFGVSCCQIFEGEPTKQLTFLRFLHFTGLVVHYGQERIVKGPLPRASPESNKTIRGISIRSGALIEPDGSARPIKLGDVLLRTVFLQVLLRAN